MSLICRAFFLMCSAAFPLLAFSQTQEKVKIGVSLPLTGAASTYGSDYRHIYHFANEELAGNRYELIFEDDRCEGRDGVSVAHKLTSIDKVSYVLGVSCDGVFSSAAPIYAKNGTLVISTAGSIFDAPSLFHSVSPKTAWVQPLVDLLSRTKGAVGIINEETGFAQGFADDFLRLSKNASLKTFSSTFATGAQDFSPLLLSMRKHGITDLLLLTQSESSLTQLVEEVRRLKFEVNIYNALLAGSPTFLKSAGSKADGITFVDMPSLSDALTPAGKELYKRFLSKYGPLQSGEGFFPLPFEGFRALHLAIESGTDPVRFLATKEFDGIVGTWRFGEHGFSVGPKMALKRIENGKVITLP